MTDRLKRALAQLDDVSPVTVRGRVSAVTGLVLRATMPEVHIGDRLLIHRPPPLPPLAGEVTGFRGGEAILMPLGEPTGVGPDSLVERATNRLSVACGPALLGRVLDGLGTPIDGGAPLSGLEPQPIDGRAPEPLTRPRIRQPLSLGVRAIDGLLTVGEGQRIGLFAGSGVGKSTLLGQIARQTDADVCVVCLVGERGREVREFIEESLGIAGLARSVVVCATSDAAPLLRLKSALTATAVAEHFRDRGQRVLLLMDSVTRYARALREVGLAAGEPPARRGFPPSVFAALPRLLERTGTAPGGSITAIYTVLVEGGDLEEPVADEVRGILDGHIVLSRELGQRGHFPAIDPLQSLSRLMCAVADEDQQRDAARVRSLLATYESKRDLILLGAYQTGSDERVDDALRRIEAIEAFLRQRPDEVSSLTEAREGLRALLA